jgi:uncharacterized protein (TIGR02996 family)
LRSEGPKEDWAPRPFAPVVPHVSHTGGSDDTERALLDEIRASPADDAARQIYADRLLERGDPLGTFIALQLGRIAAGQRLPTDEEAQLCDAHWRTWIGAPHALFAASGVAFERGMWSECNGCDAHEAGHLLRDPARRAELLEAPAWSTVRRCSLDQIPEDAVPMLLGGALARSLHALRIESQRMLDLIADWSDPPFRLRELACITYWRARRPPARGLAHMPQLAKLVTRCAREDALSWIEAAAASPAVRTLEIVLDGVRADERNRMSAVFEAAAATRLERIALTAWPTQVAWVRAPEAERIEVAIRPGEDRPVSLDELDSTHALIAELRTAFGWHISAIAVPPSPLSTAASHGLPLVPYQPDGFAIRPRRQEL